ncbi:MAG: ORF6N domain-containing protein [Candidatus Omnitrophota bacterium]
MKKQKTQSTDLAKQTDNLYEKSDIANKIFLFRGLQVMTDRDLAELYAVETKVLNQAVKRNIVRFPDIFRFQLTKPNFATNHLKTAKNHPKKANFCYP